MKKFSVFLNGENSISDFSVSCEDVITNALKDGKNKVIYVADGGLNLVLKEKISFDEMVWAGDQDSLNQTSQEFLEQKKHDHSVKQTILNKEKSYSDFSLILDNLRKSYEKESIFLEIFGGLGGRSDHEAANIEEAKWFVSQLKKGGVCFFHGGVIVTTLAIKISNCKLKSISIFAPEGFVEIKGCVYSGKFSLERPSHGLSNLAESDVAEIKPTDLAIVYLSS